jgi:hypothetical protein
VIGEKTGKGTNTMNKWCLGVVMAVANTDGTSVSEELGKKVCRPADSVFVKWPKKEDMDEPESFSWCILTDANCSTESHMGWRLVTAEVTGRNHSLATPAKKRARD